MLREQQASRGGRLRRTIRRKRALLITLFVVGGLVALLNGIGGAMTGIWVTNRVTGPKPPPSRFGAASTYDLANKQIVVFGGFGLTPVDQVKGVGAPPISTLGDMWVTTNTASEWNRRDPVHAPSRRGFAAMAYDDERKNVVLFGGASYRGNNVSDETWTWDGRDWTLQNPPVRPPGRKNAAIAYDAHRKVVVMHGGRTTEAAAAGSVLDDTWVWDGSTWEQMKVESPSARHSAAMAYDLCRARTVMFGGVGPPKTVNDLTSEAGQTWVWDGAKWTEKFPIPAPPARIGASMNNSPFSGRQLLFGGLSVTENRQLGPAVDYDVWAYDGGRGPEGTWDRLNSDVNGAAIYPVLTVANFGLTFYYETFPPPPRAYGSFITDQTTGESFSASRLVGGTPSNADPQLGFIDDYGFNENDPLLALGRSIGRRELMAPRCDNPVPIPSDDLPAEDEDSLPKEEVRDDIKPLQQLQVLLGTDRKTVLAGGAKPACLRRQGAESVESTRLVTDPKRNRIYQFFMCDQYENPNAILIRSYDGTTLKSINSVVTHLKDPDPVNINTSWGGGGSAFRNVIHDVDGGRFFLVPSFRKSLWIVDQDLIDKGVDPLTVFTPNFTPQTPGAQTRTIDSARFFTHPKTGRAKLLLVHGPEALDNGQTRNHPTHLVAKDNSSGLAQFDLEKNVQDWRTVVQGCEGSPTTPMRVENRVYTTCTVGSGNSAQTRVARFTLLENADGSETPQMPPEMFSGPFSSARPWEDPQAERILLMVGYGNSQQLWVFDGQASRWVGRVTVETTGAFGFDEQTGRLYMLAPNQGVGSVASPVKRGGLFVFDTRLSPVPQALNFTQFAYTGEAQIAALPPTSGIPRRVFVRRAGGGTPSVYPGDPGYEAQSQATQNQHPNFPDGQALPLPDEMHYQVLADELPVPEQPSFRKLDALTIPVAERSGKTDASFDAEGSGYGIRLRSLGGLQSAARVPTNLGSSGGAGAGPETLFGSGLIPNPSPSCYYPDRELMVGWVNRVSLSDLATSAQSTGLDVDDNSKVDLEGVSTRCQPALGARDLPPLARPVYQALWPLLPFRPIDEAAAGQLAWDKHFQSVECVGKDQNDNDVAAGSIFGSVTCKEDEGRVEGLALGRSSGLGQEGDQASYAIGEGSSKVEVTKDPERGIVVTATSVAKAIRLGPVSIDRVETKAVSWSNGRPSDEGRASFSRKICGVHYPDGSIPGCLTAQQQKQFVDGLNQFLSRMSGKAFLPQPDLDLLQGSPGGYVSAVTKPLAEEVEQRLFTRDSQKEVAGLVIEFTRDSQSYGFGRQTLELAGVRAFAGYAVQCQSHLMYSPSANDCVAVPDDVFEEETFEGEELFEEVGDSGLDSLEGGWTPVEAAGARGESLGARIGRFIQNLPVIRRLPIREVGDALLSWSVWLLLTIPMLLAWRRLSLNLAGGK